MPEEMLCKLGHESKTLTYLDELTNRIIEVKCQLDDKINSKELNEFFNKIYRMKLDGGYSYYPSFKGNYVTGDLIKCFESILAEKKIINLQELNKMLNKDNLGNITPATYAIQEFLNLFAIIQVNSLTLREFYCIEKGQSTTLDYYNPNMIQSNSELIEVDGIEEGMISSHGHHKLKVRTPRVQYHQH